MSVAAMTWAWRQDVTSTDKIVLLALADHADDDGACWPGCKGLAEKCSLTERTVTTALARLKEAGLVVIEERYRSNGSQTSNLIRLVVSFTPP